MEKHEIQHELHRIENLLRKIEDNTASMGMRWVHDELKQSNEYLKYISFDGLKQLAILVVLIYIAWQVT